jgi:hypothetical protein
MSRFLQALLLAFVANAVSNAGSQQEAQVGAWLSQNKGNPIALRQFAQSLPKGADLHSHLSGATYAEDYLRWGAEIFTPAVLSVKTKTASFNDIAKF